MMYGYGRDYGGMMGGGNWFYGLLLFAFMALILVGIVLLVIWAVRTMSVGHGVGAPGQAGPQQPPAPLQDEACAIARKRYAAGEITKEQYEEMCKTLAG